jgi:hypothetical protein
LHTACFGSFGWFLAGFGGFFNGFQATKTLNNFYSTWTSPESRGFGNKVLECHLCKESDGKKTKHFQEHFNATFNQQVPIVPP